MNPSAPEPEIIDSAAAVLRSGGLVAFPTETVYGLGGNALDTEAISRIFAAKGRPSYNPLIVHVADTAAASELALDWPDQAVQLADEFWPGPLTLVVHKKPIVPHSVTAGMETVALRVPSHPVAHALLAAAGVPVAAPSANRSTEISPTTAAHVLKGLSGRIDMVLDAGECTVGIESTVVDLTGAEPTLLRSGTLEVAALEAVLGKQLRLAGHFDEAAARPAPGMLARHYAPRARLVLSGAAAREEFAGEARALADSAGILGVITISQQIPSAAHHHVRMSADAREYARDLYAALHRMDDAGCGAILVERVPTDPAWAGVRDRLQRAAHP